MPAAQLGGPAHLDAYANPDAQCNAHVNVVDAHAHSDGNGNDDRSPRYDGPDHNADHNADPVGQREHRHQSGKHARPQWRRRQRQANGRAKLLLDAEQIAEGHRVAVAQHLQDAAPRPRSPAVVFHAELLTVPSCVLHPQLHPDARRVFHAELLAVAYRVSVPQLLIDAQLVTDTNAGQDDEATADAGQAARGQAARS